MINAAGYQMAIMPQLHEAGSDHVLTVKHRQPHLLTTVQTAFADTAPSTFMPEGQDRCRTRKLVAKPACSPGLRSLIRVRAACRNRHGRRPVVPTLAYASSPSSVGHWRKDQGKRKVAPGAGRRPESGLESKPVA